MRSLLFFFKSFNVRHKRSLRFKGDLPFKFLYLSRVCEIRVIIILSYSGDSRWTKDVCEEIKDKKVPVILVSRAGLKDYEDRDVYHLYVSDGENLQNRISHYASHIAMQYVMDILYSIIYNMDRNKNNRYIKDSMSYS